MKTKTRTRIKAGVVAAVAAVTVAAPGVAQAQSGLVKNQGSTHAFIVHTRSGLYHWLSVGGYESDVDRFRADQGWTIAWHFANETTTNEHYTSCTTANVAYCYVYNAGRDAVVDAGWRA